MHACPNWLMYARVVNYATLVAHIFLAIRKPDVQSIYNIFFASTTAVKRGFLLRENNVKGAWYNYGLATINARA